VETSAKSVREQTRRAVLNQRPGLASEQRQPELVAAASTWQLLAIPGVLSATTLPLKM
jgi:hypothetical protein